MFLPGMPFEPARAGTMATDTHHDPEGVGTRFCTARTSRKKSRTSSPLGRASCLDLALGADEADVKMVACVVDLAHG